MLYVAIAFLILFVIYSGYKTFKKETPDGVILITQTDEGKTLFSLELDIDPDEIKTKDRILFEVLSAE